MKLPQIAYKRRAHLGAVLTTAAAFLLLGAIDPAFAKKGGNGGNGGGGDPPATPIGDYPEMSATPINYEIRSFDAGDPADWAYPNMPWGSEANVAVRFHDINRNGVAVGEVFVMGASTVRYAVSATVAGGLQDLNSVFADSLATPDLAGFHIKYADEINAEGWVACTLIRPASEDQFWAAIGKIGASNSLRIISGPPTPFLPSPIPSTASSSAPPQKQIPSSF